MPTSLRSLWALLALLVFLCNLITPALSQELDEDGGDGEDEDDDGRVTVDARDDDGNTIQVPVERTPALYTGDFGDCLGGESLFNITKFDAGYYADNATVIFHLHGATSLREEDLTVRITVAAYGESRFEMTFNPCDANIGSLCPVKSENPIEAWAVFLVPPSDLDGIPSIALDIPDFEGSARMQIYSRSTATEIGCVQAVMRNGNSFSHPAAISSTLGALTALAVLASFATAIYGVSIAHIRTHYAHSFSVLVIFETFQTVFFSGALTVRWPSALPAWWSNFAWAGGLIYSPTIADSVTGFAGITGNASQIGGAGSTVINNEGGLLQTALSGRDVGGEPVLERRAHYNYDPSNPYDYTWSGNPMTPGMPLPGTWDGFPGTLSVANFPAATAFTVSLIWWLVALGLAALAIIVLKFVLDIFAKLKWMKQDRFLFFRSHLFGYVASSVLRTLLVATFPLMTLALFQFNLRGPAGPIAIAAVVFVILLLGVSGLLVYALFFRLRHGKFDRGRDHLVFRQGKIFKKVPFIEATRASKIAEEKETTSAPRKYATIPWYRIRFIDNDPDRVQVHKDEGFIKRFGWLSARYRRTRWWFFALWFVYQFVRACFLGGGTRTPLAQVFGLFLWEIIAFVTFIKIRPFEGQRNSVAAVWLLGLLKVGTAGFSIAFLPEFDIGRILSTVFGIIIIVIQGFVVIAIIVLVLIGVVSSWMSLNRNREKFTPDKLDGIRISYYEHMQNKAPDMPPPPKPDPKAEAAAIANRQKTFSVHSVRRNRKIEDDDPDNATFPEEAIDDTNYDEAVPNSPVNRPSRSNSVNSARYSVNSARYSVGNLPRRARAHRTSWSSRDFAEWEAQFDQPGSGMHGSMRNSGGPSGPGGPGSIGGRSRSNSLRQHAQKNSLGGSTSSMRINFDDGRPRASSDAARRMPLTPAMEIHEDSVMPGARGKVEET